MQTDNINISEIFYSIQGEGFLAGVPSVFVRIAGCPLRCKFCDTNYAIDTVAGKKMTISAIVKQIKRYPTKYIVITGGEPMVCPNLSLLCKSLKKYHITIETAGIKFIAGLKCDLMSISPKLSNAYFKPSDKKLYLKIDELQKLTNNYEYQLKFVIEKANDIKEVNQILKKITARAVGANLRVRPGQTHRSAPTTQPTNSKKADNSRVLLMPQAINLSEYIKRSLPVAELCKKYGFAFSPRLQISLWENKRGR